MTGVCLCLGRGMKKRANFKPIGFDRFNYGEFAIIYSGRYLCRATANGSDDGEKITDAGLRIF